MLYKTPEINFPGFFLFGFPSIEEVTLAAEHFVVLQGAFCISETVFQKQKKPPLYKFKVTAFSISRSNINK